MATNKNITMKQFNGVDYDTLYPKTIASQIDDVYSKSETSNLFLPKAGGSMGGILDMNGNRITNLANPVNDGDAATKEYVDGNNIFNYKRKLIASNYFQNGRTENTFTMPSINDIDGEFNGIYYEIELVNYKQSSNSGFIIEICNTGYASGVNLINTRVDNLTGVNIKFKNCLYSLSSEIGTKLTYAYFSNNMTIGKDSNSYVYFGQPARVLFSGGAGIASGRINYNIYLF